MHYVKRKQNSTHGSAPDGKHTHFLFVDTGTDTWGSELDFRSRLEQVNAPHCELNQQAENKFAEQELVPELGE